MNTKIWFVIIIIAWGPMASFSEETITESEPAKLSASRWKTLEEKYPFKAALKWRTPYFFVKRDPASGLTNGLHFTTVAYISEKNTIVLALTFMKSDPVPGKESNVFTPRFYLVGKPYLITEFDGGEVKEEQLGKILDGLKVDTLLDFFQTTLEEAQALEESVGLVKPKSEK